MGSGCAGSTEAPTAAENGFFVLLQTALGCEMTPTDQGPGRSAGPQGRSVASLTPGPRAARASPSSGHRHWVASADPASLPCSQCSAPDSAQAQSGPEAWPSLGPLTRLLPCLDQRGLSGGWRSWRGRGTSLVKKNVWKRKVVGFKHCE